LNACDDRITAVAPSCYITSWLANIENELPADAEQALPGVATAGGEMADLLLAAAPRPVLILGKEDDFFDMRGTMEVFREMHSIYKILGCAQRLNIFVAPGAHGLCQSSRERLYQFFGENIGTWAAAEEEQEIIPEKDTFCFPDGKAAGRSVAEIIKEEAELAAAKRPAMSDEEIQDALRKLLGIGEVNVPYYRQLRPTEKPGKLFSRFLCKHSNFLIRPADLRLRTRGKADAFNRCLLKAVRTHYTVPLVQFLISAKENRYNGLGKLIGFTENLFHYIAVSQHGNQTDDLCIVILVQTLHIGFH
jgi:hypothetical protein